jgi:hypothetical protein
MTKKRLNKELTGHSFLTINRALIQIKYHNIKAKTLTSLKAVILLTKTNDITLALHSVVSKYVFLDKFVLNVSFGTTWFEMERYISLFGTRRVYAKSLLQ